MRKEPAERSLWRHARRPMRGGRLWGLYLVARVRAIETGWEGAGVAGARPRGSESRASRDFGLGQSLAGPRLCGKTGRWGASSRARRGFDPGKRRARGDTPCRRNQSRYFPKIYMKRKLHIVGELMNNSYARARKAFTERDPAGYQELAKLQTNLGADFLTLNLDGTQRIQVRRQEMLDFLP